MTTEELPKTKSGLWCVQNYTRYLTEDLVAICDAVEQAKLRKAAENGIRPVPALKRTRIYGQENVQVPVITFDTYSRTKEPKGWRGQRRATENPFVKPSYRDQEVRVVVPEDMGLSDLEMLALPSDDKGTRVPLDRVEVLVKHVFSFYSDPQRVKAYESDESAVWTAMVRHKIVPLLRFGNKAKKKPVKESGDLRLRRLSRDRVKEASWSVATALRTFKEMFESIDAANAYAKKRGVASYIDKDLAKLFERQLITYRSNIDVVYNNLENSLEQP